MIYFRSNVNVISLADLPVEEKFSEATMNEITEGGDDEERRGCNRYGRYEKITVAALCFWHPRSQCQMVSECSFMLTICN